jgi:hypothetical protein
MQLMRSTSSDCTMTPSTNSPTDGAMPNGRWRDAERHFAEGNASATRWDRDAAIRFLLVHMRKREVGRAAVTARLQDAGNSRVAELFSEGAPKRRSAIHALAEQLR